MPKFTVKMTYSTVLEAANKMEAIMLAEECLKGASVVPELTVTRYKAPNSVEDTKTDNLFNEEGV